jgi:hypothetical protein
VELWSTGLPFLAQVVLVLAVVAPLCALAARVLDRMVGLVSALLTRAGVHAEDGPPPTRDE